MTELEQKIIALIESNPNLTDTLKKRYILSLFLMESDKQEEYLQLIQAFTFRCKQMDRGLFVIRSDEMKKVMKTYEEVKADLLGKLNPNLNQ
jgi:hypothetical protein